MASITFNKLQKLPSELFYDAVQALRVVCRLLGTDVFDTNYRMNYRTKLLIGCIVGFYLLTAHTVYIMYEEDWRNVLKAICMVASVVQGCVKLITVMKRQKDISRLYEMLMTLYQEYEAKPNPKYANTLRVISKNIMKIFCFFAAIYSMLLLILLATPVVLYFKTGERFLNMHFYLPGVNVATNHGFIITSIAHTICLILGSLGLFAGDIVTLLFLLQSVMFKEILKLKVEELNNALNAALAEGRQYRASKEAICDIIRWQQHLTSYTSECNDILYYIVSVQVLTSVVGILLTLFIILTSTWPGAFPYLIVTFFNLYVYFFVGTKLDICNEEFCEELYNISWYTLNAEHKRLIRLMIMKAQSPANIQIGSVLPLSVSTGLQITKTIYSITMMMIKFLVK